MYVLFILLVNVVVNVHVFIQLADDADNYLPQSHKDPSLAATNVTTSSVTSLELQTKL